MESPLMGGLAEELNLLLLWVNLCLWFMDGNFSGNNALLLSKEKCRIFWLSKGTHDCTFQDIVPIFLLIVKWLLTYQEFYLLFNTIMNEWTK